MLADWIMRVISGCGAAMSTGLSRFALGKFARFGGGFAVRSAPVTPWYLRLRLVFLPAVLFAGVVAWLLLSGNSAGRAESDPAPPATAAVQSATAEPAAASTDTVLKPAAPEQATAIEPPIVNGLKISSQSWRRGGLGSNALFTFTLRNTNDYAVKDVEIRCAFTRKDGSHLTDRTRVIPDTIGMKSRKTFTRMHVGFVNVNASKAICSLVTASRT
jgi:hypothetical protein